jgi:hypothetical protein
MEETGGPGENHRPVASHWQTLSHNVVILFGHNIDRIAINNEFSSLYSCQKQALKCD